VSVTYLRRIVNWFRGGLVLKAHRLLYHSTLGSRMIKKKKNVIIACWRVSWGAVPLWLGASFTSRQVRPIHVVATARGVYWLFSQSKFRDPHRKKCRPISFPTPRDPACIEKTRRQPRHLAGRKFHVTTGASHPLSCHECLCKFHIQTLMIYIYSVQGILPHITIFISDIKVNV